MLKEVLVIKDNKEIFDTLHTAAHGAEGNFSAYGCPDGLWRIQLSLTAAVYYSDFAQQIIENAAVSDWNYKLIYF